MAELEISQLKGESAQVEGYQKKQSTTVHHQQAILTLKNIYKPLQDIQFTIELEIII